MIAVILAAGKGRRLGEIGAKKQKAAILMKKNLNVIDKFFDKICIIIGFRKEDIIKEVNEMPKRIKDKVIYVEQKELLGNAYAVNLAINCIKKSKGSFIVINADNSLKEDCFEKILKCNAPAICVFETDRPWEHGIVTLDKEGYIINMEEKPAKGTEKSNIAIDGIYYFREDIFEIIKNIPLNEKRKEYDLVDCMNVLMKKQKIKAVMIEKPVHIINEGDIPKEFL